jgi:hypothetical protein
LLALELRMEQDEGRSRLFLLPVKQVRFAGNQG